MKAEAREDNRGTSMITVIISFALLMIFVTAFFKVQKVSQNMMMDARDMQINNRKLVESFYLSQMQDSAASGDGKLVFSGKEGSFYIDAALYHDHIPIFISAVCQMMFLCKGNQIIADLLQIT